jgi:hypothetical protein
MRRRGSLLLVVALVAALLLFGGPAADVVDDVVGAVVNGPRVGPATSLRDDGLVDADPAQLAAAAGLDLDTYALARCLMSEHGNDGDAYLIAVAWAVRNMAAERGTSVFDLLTDGKGSAGDGLFGRQDAAAGTKYASTQQDPHQRHATWAAFVMSSDPSTDPTGGATHFFSPRTQDVLHQRNPSAYKTSLEIVNSWTAPGGLYAAGAETVIPVGVDSNRLTLFRRAA